MPLPSDSSPRTRSRAIGEVAVDPRPAAVDVDLAGRLPPGGVGVGARVAAPEDQQIGERVGAGRPAVSAGRQPDGAEQLAERSISRRAAGFAASIV